MKFLAGQRKLKTRRKGFFYASHEGGFTLVELLMTLAVVTIMTLGVIPLVKVSVKRQREQRLREELRQIRNAIDQFHREAIAGVRVQTQQQQAQQPQQQQQIYVDPRVRVGITDQLIFNQDNPDRYPPDLETMVRGVSVTPLQAGPVDINKAPTENGLTSTKKKVYLRSIPIDPMTGEADWEPRSTYDAFDASSWGGENVFDVHSKSKETALDGTKYNEW